MTRFSLLRLFAIRFCTVGSLLLLVGPLAGQEDPFGAAPKPAADAAAPAAVKPPSATDPAKADPLAVQLLRASNPATPRELVQAAQSALQFGRPDESKRYLTKLLADKPADDALATLTAVYGDLLLQLDRTKELQPEGKQVAEIIYAAAERVTQNAERIAAAISQLSNLQPGARQESLGKLADAGTAVVNPMLQALADSARSAEHANIRAALVQLGGATELPLIGALDARNAELKAQIISVLARMGSTRAAPFYIRYAVDPAAPDALRQISAAALQRLSGARPDQYEAEKYLTREIDRLLQGDLPYEFDADDRVRLWFWDEAKQLVTAQVLPRSDAGLLLAARLTSELYVLMPRDPAALQRMLLTNLELAKTISGLDQPLPMIAGTVGGVALAAGPRVVNDVLIEALRQERSAAAIAAAELLGQLGDASILRSSAGSASPLAKALTFSDRRVRLAAALASVKLAAGESYPGAGRVAEVLAWFVDTSGTDVVLVGHPRGEDAQSLVGYVSALGYGGEAAYVGRALAERAFASPDHPFILIADAIDQPPVLELVQWLRRDYRTARQPIGVMARGERLETLENALRDDAFTTVFPSLYSVEVTATEIDKLKAIAGRNLVDPVQRVAQAQVALAALLTLAKNPTAFAQYDLLRHEPAIIRALNYPPLMNDAAALLAVYATPKAQSALVEFASQDSRSMDLRQAAAGAFGAAVKSHGLRLTQQQVAQQYARYKSATSTSVASQPADAATQDVLGSILRAIEGPAIARGEFSRRE